MIFFHFFIKNLLKFSQNSKKNNSAKKKGAAHSFEQLLLNNFQKKTIYKKLLQQIERRLRYKSRPSVALRVFTCSPEGSHFASAKP